MTLQLGSQPTERSSTKFLMKEPRYRETFRFLVTAVSPPTKLTAPKGAWVWAVSCHNRQHLV